MITFGKLTIEEFHQVDNEAIIKLFRISQLIIEYLLYWQEIYQTQIASFSSRMAEMNDEVY